MEQNRLLYLLSYFLGQLWNFFRLPFPGTNIPIGGILFLPMVVSLAIAFFRNLFGIGGFGQLGNTQNSWRSAYNRGEIYDKGKNYRGHNSRKK